MNDLGEWSSVVPRPCIVADDEVRMTIGSAFHGQMGIVVVVVWTELLNGGGGGFTVSASNDYLFLNYFF